MFKKMVLGLLSVIVIISVLGCGAVQPTVANPATSTEKAAVSTPVQSATPSPTLVQTTAPTQKTVMPTKAVDPTNEPTADAQAADSAPTAVRALSAVEEADLLFMREEEKLARDVYRAIDELWGVRIFANIAQSEQKHMDSMLILLEQFGIPDPVADSADGVFVNADLQALYDALIEQSSESLEAALKVGAAIEEIDILDLEEAMVNTSNADILLVYNNLTLGSYNHLRSFTSNLLRQTGEVYVPQYMTQAAFDAIVN